MVKLNLLKKKLLKKLNTSWMKLAKLKSQDKYKKLKEDIFDDELANEILEAKIAQVGVGQKIHLTFNQRF